MLDIDEDDLAAIPPDDAALAWKLLELRHLLVTGRATASETRKRLLELAKPPFPPKPRPEDN